MNSIPIIELYRTQLAEAVLGRTGDLPKFAPLNVSPWLAMSAMQKAIRRGKGGLGPPLRRDPAQNLA